MLVQQESKFFVHCSHLHPTMQVTDEHTHQAFNECLREFCFSSMDQTLSHACTRIHNLKELES